MNNILERGSDFIWKNARLLDRAIFDFHFRGGPSSRIIEVLRTYQNDDGGFGQAIEPDLRAPDSHPLFAEFALRMLYECRLRDPDIAYRVCDFLSHHADLKQGIPTIFPSSSLYPRADHWKNPGSQQPSFDRLTSLVGLASWQKIDHPWLNQAAVACLEHLAVARYDDAHTISNAFCLIESLVDDRPVDVLFNRLSQALFESDFFCLEVPVKTYGLTPLSFAPFPDSYCRRIFTDAQIHDHLDDLEKHQQADGGWSILWEPPSEMARCEWRAHKTVMALATLKAYGRI